MKKISIKLKVTLWYSLVMVILSSIVISVMISYGSSMIKHDVSERVSRVVTQISMRLVTPDGELRPGPGLRFYDQGVNVAVYDSFGNLIGGHIPFEDDLEKEFESDRIRTYQANGDRYYIFDKAIRTTNHSIIWVRGAMAIANEEYMIYSAAKTNIILAVLLILLASCGGYFIISRAFVPVNKIRKTAKEISQSSDLSRRIRLEGGKDEIHELADTFDQMLDRIEQTLEKEKQFTSDASHELRTPVAVILSECEYMLDCARTPEEFAESAASVKRQGERMSKLISQLLMISRMDKNTIQTNFESIDISELLNFICDEQEEIQSGNIRLIRNITDGIVACGDQSLLTRLFVNLISNAYAYNKENGTVTVSLYKENNDICAEVEDNGIGISPEELPKIWERFYQADPARSNNGSMGLGLSMVKWIAECHGGSVTVTSKQGVGSRFILRLPI